MDGFYKKEEAARILGVSKRQINNYFVEEKLRRVKRGRRVWIPKADVDALYSKGIKGLAHSGEDLNDLHERVSSLEDEVSILKLGMGFGAPRSPRHATDLLLIRQTFLDDISKGRWTRRRMSQVSDELMTIQDVEVAVLCEQLGPDAWLPMTDLISRMMLFVESRSEFPGRGLDVLLTRMTRARDRFYGMIYAAQKSHTPISKKHATSMFRRIEEAPLQLERHILSYIARSVG